MVTRKIKCPSVMIVGRKAWFWLCALAGLALILGVLWGCLFRAEDVPHTYFSGQSSLPVGAQADGESIQFQFENIKPDVTGENYFVNYRLQREQYRQETKEMLSELLNSSIEKTKEQAQAKWLELCTKIQKEDEIENLLKIKGFQDSVVDVLPENVTVFVYASNLTPGEVGIIQDIITRVTNVRIDKIKITAKS